VAPIELRKVQRVIDATSYLEAERDLRVVPRVNARVVEVLADEGQAVQAGQLLARLDDREAKATVEQTKIQIADREVRLELARLEVEASARRIEQARIERDKARSQHERNTKMDPGLISAKELEESGWTLEGAEQALNVATYNSSKAKLEVHAAERAIEELGARLEQATINLSEHEIRAPFAGVIAECNIKGGENVTAASSFNVTSLFRLIDREALVSYLSRPQRELPLVKSARDVQFTTDAWPGRTFRASVDVVSPVVDEATGSFKIRIRVDPESARELLPGMFVRAHILTEQQREAVMVPKAAVLNDGAQSIVFVVRDGTAHRIVLEVGLEEQDHIEARNTGDNGLAPNEQVIVSGHHDLRDGAAVETTTG
jgi:membrane fusion protein (multidrug efflux system)